MSHQEFTQPEAKPRGTVHGEQATAHVGMETLEVRGCGVEPAGDGDYNAQRGDSQ